MKKVLPLLIAILVAMPMVINATSNNNPPEKPVITGPSEGEAGKTYTYTITSTDPDGDKIYYCINWGDGNEFCTDLMESGEEYQASHAWQEKGTYVITVTATDEHGATSEPATLQVKMPFVMPIKDFRILKPRYGIYVFGFKVFPMFGQIVIGDIKVQVKAPENVVRVEFLLPLACHCGMEMVHVDATAPFEWNWNRDYDDKEIKDEGFTELVVRGYDSEWNEYKDSITLYKVRI